MLLYFAPATIVVVFLRSKFPNLPKGIANKSPPFSRSALVSAGQVSYNQNPQVCTNGATSFPDYDGSCPSSQRAPNPPQLRANNFALTLSPFCTNLDIIAFQQEINDQDPLTGYEVTRLQSHTENFEFIMKVTIYNIQASAWTASQTLINVCLHLYLRFRHRMPARSDIAWFRHCTI